jgi:hypothetical protein
MQNGKENSNRAPHGRRAENERVTAQGLFDCGFSIFEFSNRRFAHPLQLDVCPEIHFLRALQNRLRDGSILDRVADGFEKCDFVRARASRFFAAADFAEFRVNVGFF